MVVQLATGSGTTEKRERKNIVVDAFSPKKKLDNKRM